MNAGEIIDAAMALALEFHPGVPSTKTLLLHRIEARQQQIGAHIADMDPEYLGKSAAAILGVVGSYTQAYALSGLNPKHERVTHVEVLNPGGSAYVVGKKVSVVPVMDIRAALAPRMHLRDNVLYQVGTDLANVTSLTIHYSKRFAAVTALASAIEMPEQFQYLLVLDLARHLLRKTISMKPEARTAAIAIVDLEEAELLGDFDRHLEHLRYAEVARFTHSQQAQARPMV